jgi:predicted RNA binding protein YcfA (HicA-like mRNA interferase family)
MGGLKRLSGKAMCNVLEAKGWVLDRVSGSHHVYRHGDGRTVPVPVHGNRTMKRGTQRSLMRLAGLEPHDL